MRLIYVKKTRIDYTPKTSTGCNILLLSWRYLRIISEERKFEVGQSSQLGEMQMNHKGSDSQHCRYLIPKSELRIFQLE